jgi:hypothetical protein
MSDSEIPFRPDVPAGSSALVVKTPEKARALALRTTGQLPPDEMRFACVCCGWDKTMKFDEGEIEALGGDISSYTGPCPKCDSQTLVPRSDLLGDDFKPAMQRAKEARHEEYSEAADVFIEKVQGKVVDAMAGGIFGATGSEAGSTPTGPTGSATRDNFPDADDVADDLKPRGE